MPGPWLPLSMYAVDRRAGEGPQVELHWLDEWGVEQTGVGCGFVYWDANAEREVLLFASGGLVRRPTGYREIPTTTNHGGDNA